MARDEEDEGEEGLPIDWEKITLRFLEDHRDAIGAGLREWGRAGKRRGWMLVAVMVFLGGIVGFTGYLTLVRSLPGEAFTFLVGTVLMYLFNLIGPRIQVG